MIDTPDDLLLLEAEHLARDLLLDVDHTRQTAASLLNGWAPVLASSTRALAHDPTHPLSQVLQIWQGMRHDARDWIGHGRPDPRLTRISELLDDIATQPPTPASSRTRRAAVLHTCYLTTHALSTSLHQHADLLHRDQTTQAQGTLVGVLATRTQTAEQVLDAHLGLGRAGITPPGTPATALVAAIAGWDQALHRALVDQTPDPRTLLASANVALGLLRHTTDLARHSLAQPNTNTFDIQDRLLPALERAIHSWQQDRGVWRGIAPMTTGIVPDLAAAAHTLHGALQTSADEPAGNEVAAQRLAIAAVAEAAHLQLQATRRPDLKGTATGVANLTQAVLDQVPGARQLEAWHQLERLDGPQLISIPTPVRTELLREAASTLTVTAALASAAHGLGRTGPETGPAHPRPQDLTRHLRPHRGFPVGPVW